MNARNRKTIVLADATVKLGLPDSPALLLENFDPEIGAVSGDRSCRSCPAFSPESSPLAV